MWCLHAIHMGIVTWYYVSQLIPGPMQYDNIHISQPVWQGVVYEHDNTTIRMVLSDNVY